MMMLLSIGYGNKLAVPKELVGPMMAVLSGCFIVDSGNYIENNASQYIKQKDLPVVEFIHDYQVVEPQPEQPEE